MFVFTNVFLSNVYVRNFLSMLYYPKFSDCLGRQCSKGSERKWNLGCLLVFLTLPDCSSTFARNNFVTGRTTFVEVRALPANRFIENEGWDHLSMIFLLCHLMLTCLLVHLKCSPQNGSMCSLVRRLWTLNQSKMRPKMRLPQFSTNTDPFGAQKCASFSPAQSFRYVRGLAGCFWTGKGTPVQVPYHVLGWTKNLCRLTLSHCPRCPSVPAPSVLVSRTLWRKTGL